MTEAFDDLLRAAAARGLPDDLVAPGRSVTASDVPGVVAAVYERADGMDRAGFQQRYWGIPAELMPMAELLGEQRAREVIEMHESVAARLGGADPYWADTWWPLLTASPKDVVAVDRVTGEVWFSYSEAEIKEVIAPSLEAYWSGCARWVQNFTFDTAEGLWNPVDGYRGCEGPWDPNELGTGTTSTQFPTVGM